MLNKLNTNLNLGSDLPGSLIQPKKNKDEGNFRSMSRNIKVDIPKLDLRRESNEDTDNDMLIFSPKKSDVLKSISLKRRSTIVTKQSFRRYLKTLV